MDGLRALAIIPVVIYHAFPKILPGGFVGVDIFFVISGFLISGIIFKGLQQGSFRFSNFYANRIKRIFPALLLVLGVCFAFGWFFLLPGEYAELGKHIAGGVAYIENLVLRREAGYFDTKSALKPLMHLWSLGIEEQFYITYPFLLWLFWRLRCNLLSVLAPLALISFSLNIWTVRQDAVSAFFLPQTRFWELLAGGMLAYLQIFEQPVPFSRAWGQLTHRFQVVSGRITLNALSAVVGLFLVGVGIFRVHERDAFPGWWALVPVWGSVLLIFAGPENWINRKILSNRTAVLVGLISYPLYLWHWPILSLLRTLRGDELPVVTRVIAVVLSVLLSWLTWKFVESPIRFGSRSWFKPAALVAVSVIVGFAGFVAHGNQGFISRFKNLPDDLGRSHPETYSTAECRKSVGSEQMSYCRSNGAGAPQVALVGDSHAASLYRGLGPAYGHQSEILMNLGVPGCVPFYDTESYSVGIPQVPDCEAVVNRMLDFVASTPSIRTIVLSFRGPLNMSGVGFGAAEAGDAPKRISWSGAATGASQAEVFASALRNTLVRLADTGKEVIVFLDWPELGFDPKSCLPRPVTLFSGARSFCGVPREEVEVRNRGFRQTVSKIGQQLGRVTIFDPFPFLCDASACYAMSAGHLLYRDDNHLSAAGAAYLSSNFLKTLPSGPSIARNQTTTRREIP